MFPWLRQFKQENIPYQARFRVPPLSLSCDPNTNHALREQFPWLRQFELLNRRIYLTRRWHVSACHLFAYHENIPYQEVARFRVPPLSLSCDPNTNHALREQFPWLRQFELLNRRIYLTRRWHVSACHLFAYHENIPYQEVARFRVPPLSLSCDPNTNHALREQFPWLRQFELLNRRIYLTRRWHVSACHLFAYHEVARFRVPPLSLSCDPNTNHALREQFPWLRQFELLNRRIYLTRKWHVSVCHLFPYHVILIQITLCGNSFHGFGNLNF
ncbi:hypothetical protein V1477_020892 [Vespula maculifrons]|uniref:Uncharacterized protein n=1 Tax=Vespula maculifrons TaxID=7453 RepID=A0ABD2AN66_VESMC